VAPIIKPNLVFSVPAGGSFAITGVADSDDESISLRWTLMEEATGQSVSGKGRTVSVSPRASPGDYQLLITADDGRGGVTEAAARVEVKTAAAQQAAALRAQGMSAAAATMAAQTLAPSIYVGKLAATPKLPSLTFYQGATFEVHAATSGLFDLSRPGWMEDLRASTCVWSLRGLSEGAAAGGATVYGCAVPARFRLHTAGEYELLLEATDKASGEVTTATATVTVKPKPDWGSHFTSASQEAFSSGRCLADDAAYFFATEFSTVALGCPGVSLLPGWGAELGDAGARAARRPLGFSWKLTPLTQRAAAAHRKPLTKGSQGGAAAAFGAVAPGLYQVEIIGSTGGGGGGGASSIRTVYYLSTILVVEPTTKLRLPPPPAACAGKTVSLAPAALALLPTQYADDPRWKVAWADSRAGNGRPFTLTGSGGSFSFVSQPGRYYATVTVDVTEPGSAPRRLTGRALVEARPCFRCAAGPAEMLTARNFCGVAARDAARLLAERPAWLGTGARLGFAPGSDLRPGMRAVTLVASSYATNITASCTVPAVSIKDAAAPRVALRRLGGACVAPAGGKWACLKSDALVTATDNCVAVRPLEYLSYCGAGTTADDCKVLPDGRVCLRADPPKGDGPDASRVAHVGLLYRDGWGNALPAPFKVPVTFHRAAAPGCVEALLERPE
jgi:hypothetical protein